ncbi:MAG: CPBP family intramembrane glutamic endopeptidase [Candidatus Acidiferrales bacterium]
MSFFDDPSQPAPPGGPKAAPESSSPVTYTEVSIQPPAQQPDPQAALPIDLRVPWGWKDLVYLILFVIGALVFFEVALVIVAIAFFHVSSSQLTQATPTAINISVIAQALAFLAMMGYFWVMVRVRHAGPFWQAIGWRPFHTGVNQPQLLRIFIQLGLGVGLAIAITPISILISRNQPPLPIEKIIQTRGTYLLFMVYGILIAPVVEETLFRGFLYPIVARRFGLPAGVLVSGILFGMLHASQLWGGWGSIGLIIGVGIVFSWVRARSKTVLASYLLHIAYNSTLFAFDVLVAHTLQNMPPGH